MFEIPDLVYDVDTTEAENFIDVLDTANKDLVDRSQKGLVNNFMLK